MKKKKISKNKKKFLNIFFNIFGFISLLVVVIFSFYIFKLDMLPSKYLKLIFGILIFFYVVLFLLTIPKKIKVKIKTICFVLFVIFDLIFGIGIIYLNKTIHFLDVINNELFQKEDYYLMVLEDSNYENIKDLKDTNIGIYTSASNENMEVAITKLEEKLYFVEENYKEPKLMVNDLKEGKISSIFVNSSTRNLIESEIDKDIELRVIDTVTIDIEKIDVVKQVDVTNKTFNVYLAGADSFGNIDKITNTDVNMIATIDPVNKKILLTSIPRDYYVNLPSYGENTYDKLTHAGYYGIDESIFAIEKLLDIDINYYVKVNFSTVIEVIDAIGGIDVYSDFAFKERSFKKYYFNVGMNHLNGEQALAFSRERKSFVDGDIQRVKNQQKVMKALLDKVSKSTALITKYTEILESVSDKFITNLDRKSINKLVKMQLNNMASWKLETQNLTGYDLYTTNTYSFPGTELYVMKQNETSVKEVSGKIKSFINK